MTRVLDSVDWSLLHELQDDARLSYAELARRVHMSTPAVAERVRRLEQQGVITGYHARVSLPETGWPVLALVRMACHGPTCLLRDPTVHDWPEVLEIHRVTGSECAIVKVAAPSMAGFESLIDRLAVYGTPASTLVLSTPLERSPISTP
jgi:Lrp/AsnC family leucine-responsive transcriptional regulator